MPQCGHRVDPHNGSQSIALINAHLDMIGRISNMVDEPSPEEIVARRRADRKARLKWCKIEPGAEDCPFLLENERRRLAGEQEEVVDRMVKNYTLGADGQPRLRTFWERARGQ